MKFFIFLLLLFLVFLSSASLAFAGVSPSPGRLYFDAGANNRICQTITLSSSDYQGDVKVRDVWATSTSEGANINKYTASASDFGITLEYPKTITGFNGNAEVEVCLTQQELVKAKGGIIFTPSTGTNVVVENGVWLFINLSPAEQTSGSSTTSVSSSSGGNSESGKVILGIDESKQTSVQEIVDTNSELAGSGITGASVGTSNNSLNLKAIIIILVIIGAFIGLLNYRKIRQEKRRFMEYGY